MRPIMKRRTSITAKKEKEQLWFTRRKRDEMFVVGDQQRHVQNRRESRLGQATSRINLPSKTAGPDALLQAFAIDANRNEIQAVRLINGYPSTPFLMFKF